jgi:hypothetical protein
MLSIVNIVYAPKKVDEINCKNNNYHGKYTARLSEKQPQSTKSTVFEK